jgi:hypothetical protein
MLLLDKKLTRRFSGTQITFDLAYLAYKIKFITPDEHTQILNMYEKFERNKIDIEEELEKSPTER